MQQDDHVPGPGTYAHNGFIYAAVVGELRQSHPEGGNAAALAAAAGGAAPASARRPVLEVARGEGNPVVPEPGAVVTAKVSQVGPSGAHCRILCVGDRALDHEFKGIIRSQDVRANEVDKVVPNDCFRPGDVVQAAVLSLGDARSYHLTTAREDLGVVYAVSVAGNEMRAASWEEMVDPETGRKEKRKVARVPSAQG